MILSSNVKHTNRQKAVEKLHTEFIRIYQPLNNEQLAHDDALK
jgi:hypothetical protein